MIAQDDEGLKYLEKLRDGTLEKGLGIGCLLDDHLLFKRGQLVMINGHDNVGKTFWIAWYFLCLSQKNGLRFTIFSSENSIAKLKRDLIQFKTGKKLEDISEKEFYLEFNLISNSFKFLAINETYTFEQVMVDFKKSDTDAYLIDPLTSIMNSDIKVNKHETDNENMLKLRAWLYQNNKTIYINTHCSTESTRKIYPKDHDLKGHIMPPMKSDTLGGQKYADRADDFITIHRLTQHESNWMNTEVHIRKIKDTMTGGKTTFLEFPMIFRCDYGNQFSVGGTNPLNGKTLEPEIVPQLTEMSKLIDPHFDNETPF